MPMPNGCHVIRDVTRHKSFSGDDDDDDDDAVRGMLGEFWAHIACLWLGLVGRNHFINTKFTKLIMEIADSNDDESPFNSRLISGWTGGRENN